MPHDNSRRPPPGGDPGATWQELRDAAVAAEAARRVPPVATPQTDNQRAYVRAMLEKQVVLCGGPSGTGKTLLAVSTAVSFLRHGRVDGIIFTRPTATVGNPLGHLPGDLKEKMSPHVSNLRRHLLKFMTAGELADRERAGVISFDPIQFMRGESFARTFIVADEMQNATRVEYAMLATRLEGDATKLVINGDEDQVDIHHSYLATALRKFHDRDPAIAVVRMTDADILRSRIVRVVVGIMREPD